MSYSVKEIFYTLQGEGTYSGRAAVFCRFSGCNLWDGKEASRASAACAFCDTDFVGTDGSGGGVFQSAAELVAALDVVWRGECGRKMLVLTGGEPALQVDDALINAAHAAGFYVTIETNGTRRVPDSIDWICVSPKAGTILQQTWGDEIKVVLPQSGIGLGALSMLDFMVYTVQPKFDSDYASNVSECVSVCLHDPRWTLGLQLHKIVGVR